MNYPYAVVPSAGMYGDGQVRAISLHTSFPAAKRKAEKMTNRHREDMAPHGGSSGGYYVAVWGQAGRTFWADMPPAVAETEGGAG